MADQKTKTCQNCKTEFLIEPRDFEFYQEIKVPAPTFCPSCRFQRRLMFLNVLTLYKRKCDLCGNEEFSVFSPNKPFVVYCPSCWFSDKWDPVDYAMEYDPSKHFFEQIRALQLKVPMLGLFGYHPNMVNSKYNNYAFRLKDSYLLFDAGNSENCYYSWMINDSKDSLDLLMVEGVELCYENIVSDRSYNTHFSEDIEDCRNVYFSRDMNGCSDCFACANLRQKQFHIFNQPYTKEEYQRKIKEFHLSSFQEFQKIKEEAEAFWLKYPQKFIHGYQNENVSGDYIFYSKNVHNSYIVEESEDSRYLQLVAVGGGAKRCYDYTSGGANSEYVYECITGAGSSRARFNFAAEDSLNTEYSIMIDNSQEMLGCIGMKKKSHCILNKQYKKEDYKKLKAQILEDIKKNPYVDKLGRVFSYGEFLPYDLSYFDYNETLAQSFFPLSQERVEEQGWRWKEREKKIYETTKNADDLPDDIRDAGDDILNEIIACAGCGRGYHIVSGELALLRGWGFPLPRECFWCRNHRRFLHLNPPRFYRRECAKCKKEIVTAYDPSRPETIYCESCYLSEVL